MKLKFQPIVFVLSLILLATSSSAQQRPVYWYNDSAAHKLHIRNVIFCTPVGKTSRINGLAIGFAARPWFDADSLEVNGLNIEINPISPVNGIAAIMSAPIAPFRRGNDELINSDSFPQPFPYKSSIVNGLTISSGIWPGTNLNGVSLSLSGNFANTSDGIEVSGIVNMHYRFNGISIALLRNKATIGKGIQIGLFNSCKKGRLLQIGLINRAGNRIIPFLNLHLDGKGLNLGPSEMYRSRKEKSDS